MDSKYEDAAYSYYKCKEKEMAEAAKVEAQKQITYDQLAEMTNKHEKLGAMPNVDLKTGLGNRKPPVGYVTRALAAYAARASQYGGEKYGTAGNYLRPAPDGDDLGRLFQYLCAAQRHISAVTDAIVRFKAGGVNAATTVHGAAYCPDRDGHDHPVGNIASNLPSLCGAVASLNIALQQAVDCGLLPADPGITWDVEALKAFRESK